jgi:uncharacterized protein
MKRKIASVASLAAGAVICFFLFTSVQQAQEGAYYRRIFTKRDVMIPMRDGVRLNTEIYTPLHAEGPLPFIYERTPYGLHDDPDGFSPKLDIYSDLIHDGYIFVFQDIRGRYKSEGKFVMLRDPCPPDQAKCIDEGTDTNDTVAWLLKNVPNNNGRVGILGISYGGWLTAMAMLHPNPAIKAVSEQASPADMFLGDDFHHNGAFRLSYGFQYVADMETSKSGYALSFDKYDTYDWYLNTLGALSNANEHYFHFKLPSWNNFVNHPNYDEFWQKQAVTPYLTKVTVPNLNVAGWWDQEDFYGPVKIYETLEKHDTRHWNYLVVGPWRHGGWSFDKGYKLGNIEFGSDTSRYFQKNVQAAWFAYWLKDEGHLPFKEALTFQTGTNEWKAYDQWPPRENVVAKKLYFRSGHDLSFDPPTTNGPQALDSYVSDPEHPVPYRHRPIAAWRGWTTWLVQDQRFVYLRPDVLSYQTGALSHDVTVSGDIVAHLKVSTTGTDGDWIVKLIDVYPELSPSANPDAYTGESPREGPTPGYQLMIADEVFRGRFRNSFEHPEPLVPGQVTPITIDLHTNNHTFLKGHRIMVQVQSTWFPLIDRNPQKFVPNIFKATADDYQKATIDVYRSGQDPSYVEVPVAPN